MHEISTLCPLKCIFAEAARARATAAELRAIFTTFFGSKKDKHSKPYAIKNCVPLACLQYLLFMFRAKKRYTFAKRLSYRIITWFFKHGHRTRTPSFLFKQIYF